MQMICRECKKIITLSELTAFAAGHFTKQLFSAGLATWLASAIKDYFSQKNRGFIDETMAGACNGFEMPCPKCQKILCWKPLATIQTQQKKRKRVSKNFKVFSDLKAQIFKAQH